MGLPLLLLISEFGCNGSDRSPVEYAADAATEPPLDGGQTTSIDGGLAPQLDAGSDATSFAPLIDNRGWRRYDAAVDPLRTHQPFVIVCRDSATVYESGSYEIDTTRCNYVVSEHPAQRAIPAGVNAYRSRPTIRPPLRATTCLNSPSTTLP